MRDQVEALRRRGDVEVELFHFAGGTRNYARAARELRRRYEPEQFDVVHVHFGLVAWPALLAGLRPLVVTLHGNDLLHPKSKPVTRAALPLHRPARRGLARVQRERARARAARGAWRSSRAASTSTRFRPIPRAEARERLGLDPAGPYLLFPHETSRPLKRFDRAREVAGDMPLLTLGGVPAEEVPYWINAANAVVVPSQDEGMGLAVIEASACEVPAFGTPVGAHAVALAGIEGSACLEWDRERGATALAPHVAAPDPRVDGRPAAERFSADRMAARVVAAWQALLQEAA